MAGVGGSGTSHTCVPLPGDTSSGPDVHVTGPCGGQSCAMPPGQTSPTLTLTSGGLSRSAFVRRTQEQSLSLQHLDSKDRVKKRLVPTVIEPFKEL